MKKIVLLISHLAFLAIGVVIGIYLLPVLIAPPSPTADAINAIQTEAQYTTQFDKDLAGSDWLHWGQGQVSITHNMVALRGSLAPGPDYQLYLTPTFVDTAESFVAIKDQSVKLAAVNTFENFMVPFDSRINIHEYQGVVVWCEAFGKFITAAKYR